VLGEGLHLTASSEVGFGSGQVERPIEKRLDRVVLEGRTGKEKDTRRAKGVKRGKKKEEKKTDGISPKERKRANTPKQLSPLLS